MNRRLAAYGAVAVLSLVTARLVAGDLAALHRRATAPVPAAPAPRPAPPAVPEPVVRAGTRALAVTTDPPWSPPAGSVVDVYAASDPLGLGGRAAPPATLVADGATVLRKAKGDHPGRVTLLVSVGAAPLVAAAAAAGPVVLALAPDEPSKEPPSRTSSSASSRE